jgi:hypothetical protein
MKCNLDSHANSMATMIVLLIKRSIYYLYFVLNFTVEAENGLMWSN